MERKEVILSQGDGLQNTEILAERIGAVCYIEVEGPTKKRASGFYSMLSLEGSDDIFYGVFTNNHVLATKLEALKASATFGYEGCSVGEKIKLRPEVMFRTHKELDYTFVGINKEEMDNLQSSLGCKIEPIVMESEPELKEGMLISIFQHPEGRSKEWSVKEILRIKKPFVYYKADTEPGSSGSPVLTSPAMKIVAIHCTGKQDEYNKGTLCSEVIMHLNKGTYTQPSGGFPGSETFEGRKEPPSKDASDDTSFHPPTKVARTDKHSVKKGTPTNDELDLLSDRIAEKWKPLGRRLKIIEAKLTAFHKENEEYTEKAYKMLLHWKNRDGQDATYSVLYEALCSERVNEKLLAEEICCK